MGSILLAFTILSVAAMVIIRIDVAQVRFFAWVLLSFPLAHA